MAQQNRGVSWVGTACYCLDDSERQLAAARDQPFLREDIRAKEVAEGAKRVNANKGQISRLCPSSPAGRLFLYKGHSSDEVLRKIEVAVGALTEALAPPSDYKRAQSLMMSLHDLERVLWQACTAEAREAAAVESKALQGAHEGAKATLERDYRRREEHLKDGCREQVEALRRAHQAVAARLQETLTGVGLRLASRCGPADQETLCQEAQQHLNEGHRELGQKHMNRAREQGQSCGSHVPLATHARGKQVMELRLELATHLAAIAQAGSDQPWHHATRIMSLMHNLEEEARRSKEFKAQSAADQPAKIMIHQQHAQAEDIQRGKHERLLRALERAHFEDIRLLQARHRSARSRLAERCQVENRRREQELRGKLASLRGQVARVWQEHNRRVRGLCPHQRQAESKAAKAEHCASAAACLRQKASSTTTQERKPPSCDEGVRRTLEPVDASHVTFDSRTCKHTSLREDTGTGMRISAGSRDQRNENYVDTSIAKPSSATEHAEVEAGAHDTTKISAALVTDMGSGAQEWEKVVRKEQRVPPEPSASIKSGANCAGEGETSCGIRGLENPKCGNNRQAHEGCPRRKLHSPEEESATGTNGATKRVVTRNNHTQTAYARGTPRAMSASRGSQRQWRRGRRRQRLALSTAAAFEPGDLSGAALRNLSKEETQRLAALGRGAPSDPHLLLASSTPLPPSPLSAPERTKIWQTQDVNGNGSGVSELQVAGVDHDDVDELLDRVVDRVAWEMQAEENMTRRRLGMSPC